MLVMQPLMLISLCLMHTPDQSISQEIIVTTWLKDSLPMDAFIVSQDGTILTAGGYQRDFIAKITPDGETIILAKGLKGPVHLIQDAKGDVWVSEFVGHQITRIRKDGSKEVVVQGLDAPTAMAFGPKDQLWIANYGKDYRGRTIVRRQADGSLETMVDSELINGPIDLVFDDQGNLYIASQNTGRIVKRTPDGVVHPFAQVPTQFLGHMVKVKDVFYVTGIKEGKVFRVDQDGTVTHFAGSGKAMLHDGPAYQAGLPLANGLAPSHDGEFLLIGTALSLNGNIAIRKIILP